jgi:hypothetical protein
VAEYDYQRFDMPRGTDRATAQNILTIHAVYGDWELSRVRVWPDGRRRVELRRRHRPGRSAPPLPS